MIQKGSQIGTIDKCNVWIINTFHIYRGFRHKVAKFGSFLRVSIRKTRPKAWIKKGKKSKAIFLRSCFKKIKKDGSYIKFKTNNAVLLKKRLTPRGRELEGPIFYGLKRKKFNSSFASII